MGAAFHVAPHAPSSLSASTHSSIVSRVYFRGAYLNLLRRIQDAALVNRMVARNVKLAIQASF